MSQETEKDLLAKISDETCKADFHKAEVERLNAALKVIRETPKKPEPRLGDFGDNHPGSYHMVKIFNDKPMSYLDQHGGMCNSCGLRVHGNIFDLMKQAGPGGVIVALPKATADHYAANDDWEEDTRVVHRAVKAALDRQK